MRALQGTSPELSLGSTMSPEQLGLQASCVLGMTSIPVHRQVLLATSFQYF